MPAAWHGLACCNPCQCMLCKACIWQWHAGVWQWHGFTYLNEGDNGGCIAVKAADLEVPGKFLAVSTYNLLLSQGIKIFGVE